jgi:hypothetical protein
MRQQITCPYCRKPFTQDILENAADSLPVQPIPRMVKLGFWATDLGLSIGLGSVVWGYTWLYGHSPLWSVVTVFGVGFGLPVLRLVLDRPVIKNDKPRKETVSIEIVEKKPTHYNALRDEFRHGITTNDLIRISHAKSFSRDGATKAGLSQTKWHYIKSEFLRMNLAVPDPNGANRYHLTIRGKKLIEFYKPLSRNDEQR